MARAILIAVHALLPGLALAFACVVDAAQPRERASPCPATIAGADAEMQRSYLEFRKSIESGPMYRHGKRPGSCEARAEGGALWLNYKFVDGGGLDAHRDPAIELTEQRLDRAGLSAKTALDVLRRTERWAHGKGGCGIAWKRSPTKEPGAASGGYELAYRGDECNCQARLLYGEKRLVGLAFRSAC